MRKRWLYLCGFGCLLAGITVFLMEFNRTYTYVARNTYFPSNATWQTAPYAVGVTVDGELGKEYTDFGDKRVFVEIYHNQISILQKEYVIKGGDIEWKVRWKELALLQIDFSDSEGDPGKIIQAISFRIDTLTNRAIETE